MITMGINLWSQGGGAAAAFDPASLFAGGELGGWFDPADLTTLFTDPAGTTQVTADAQTVGLALDKSQGLTLGAELVANGGFTNPVTTGWAATGGTLSVVSGWLRLTSTSSPAIANYAFTTVVGRTYQIYGDWRSSAGTWRIIVGTTAGGSTLFNISAASAGTSDGVFVATGTTTYISVRSVTITIGNHVEIDNISVKELPGSHAFQSNAAFRPQYKSTGALRDDASDDVLAATFPDLGTAASVAYASNLGVTILTAQTIGAGAFDILRDQDLFGMIVINRALTGAETTDVTAYLTEKAGL